MVLQLAPRGADEEVAGPDLVARLPGPRGPASLAAALRGVWSRLEWQAIAVSVACALLTLLAGGAAGTRTPAVVLAAATTGTCIGMAWQTSQRRRLAWGAIAFGSALWCAGNGSRPVWEMARSGAIEPVGLGDVGAVGAMLFLALGVLLHLEPPARRVARIRSLAEGLMLGASILFASWVLIMPPAFEVTSGRSLADQAHLLAYPAGEVLLLTVVVFAFTRISQLGRWSVLLLGGLGAIALLESTSSQLTASEAGRLHLLDAGTAVAFSAIIVGAARSWRTVSNDDRASVTDRAQLVLLSAPGLSVLIVVGTTIRQATGQPVAAELTWITIGVLTLSVLLHLTVIFENHALSAELALARDEAIHASNLKSRFLANVSHEIRTPMNAVIGLTGLLLDTKLEADQRELAVGVATSAEGLLGLIDEVLDFSKIEAEKVELEEIDLSLDDLVGDVAMIVGDAARRKGIDLYAYCAPGLVTSRRGDPVRLRQILLNLAGNAVKFTHEGSVTIEASEVEGSPGLVAFLVVDTGIGIPAADQARLFEPFSQLDETTTRKFGGTGLGLGIVNSLVDLQGGTIELASEPGVGTAFRVTIPMPMGVDQGAERDLAALVGLRALIVDGNAVNRSVLAHTLQGWGFTVDQATTAEEALHLYGWSQNPSSAYAVAIVEHRLGPGMDGVALARVLRAQGPTSDAAIFLLSAQIDLSRQAARDAGIESVLVKPVRNTYLLRRIIDALITNPTHESRVSVPSLGKVALHAPRLDR